MNEDQPTNHRTPTDIQAILTILAKRIRLSKGEQSDSPDAGEAETSTHPDASASDSSEQNLS